jgi:RNA polymerase sigma-70 factor (ECF subfamily)
VTSDPPERPLDQEDVDQLLQSWVVAEAVARLSPEHRRVLYECYYQGRSMADAASRVGVPEGTVKSRLHYALRALRLALEEMGVTG